MNNRKIGVNFRIIQYSVKQIKIKENKEILDFYEQKHEKQT